MKRNRSICPIILLFAVFMLCSCGKTPSQGASSTPAPTEAATPSPTPEPTPIPYDLVAEQSGIEYSFLQNREEYLEALSLISSNAGAPATDPRQDEPELSAVRVNDTGTAGDYMARSGDILYILTERELAAVKLAGAETRVLGRYPVGVSWTGRGEEPREPVSGYEKTPLQVYCSGDRLVVLSDWYGYDNSPWDINYTEYIAVDIYDVKDPSGPRLLNSFGQSGIVSAAGIWKDTFYLVTDCPAYADDTGTDAALPTLYSVAGSEPLPFSGICFAKAGSYNGCALMCSYDLKTAYRSDSRAMLGVSADAYTGDGKLYMTVPRTAQSPSRTISSAEEFAFIRCSDVYCWSLENGGIELKAAGTVNGVIPDSGCMYLNGDDLWCLTNLDQRLFTGASPEQWDSRETGSALYRLDEDLHPTGVIAADAQEPQISWVGFLGSTAAVSTDDGRTFLADLSEPPASPSGNALKTEINAHAIRSFGESGYTAFYRTGPGKLELTVYDEKLKMMDSKSFGSDHSSTLDNLRGYTVDGRDGIVAFSADDSYCLYSFGKKEGLTYRAGVYLNDWAWNARGFSDEGYFYTADRNEIAVTDKKDMSEIQRVYF